MLETDMVEEMSHLSSKDGLPDQGCVDNGPPCGCLPGHLMVKRAGADNTGRPWPPLAVAPLGPCLFSAGAIANFLNRLYSAWDPCRRPDACRGGSFGHAHVQGVEGRPPRAVKTAPR